MRVRVLKPWRGRKPGAIMPEVPDGVAELLICRGVVERCVEEPEDAVPPPSQNGKARRKRRRKEGDVRTN